VRWAVTAVVLLALAIGVTVGVAVQRSVDSGARRVAAVSAFRQDVAVDPICGNLPASPVLAPVGFPLGPAYDWSEGRQLWGTLQVYNDGHSDVRIERLDVVWPWEHNEPLQIAIRQRKALRNGCVPRPVDDTRGTLLSGPVTLSPGQSAWFEYSIVMMHCRGLSPDVTFGGPSPFRWTMMRDGERFRFAAGPSDDLKFQISQASACSNA
jgi:hypothetical protein